MMDCSANALFFLIMLLLVAYFYDILLTFPYFLCDDSR